MEQKLREWLVNDWHVLETHAMRERELTPDTTNDILLDLQKGA